MLTTTYALRAWRALALGALLLALGAPAHAQSPGIDSVVEQALRDGRDLPVIVRYKTNAGFERGKKGSGSGRREVRRYLKSLRAVGMKVNGRALRELIQDGDIAGISYDAPVQGNQLLPPVIDPVNVNTDASAARIARLRYGVTGYGVTVAVIDSGVKPHVDLPASRIRAFVDYVNGQTTPYDDYGHGTHVAGIIAGSGASRSDQKYRGVAPSASIVALKVLDANGMGRTTDVMAALEWVLANHLTYNIRVVNLSLGHPIYEPAATDPLVQLVDRLSQRGIVVSVSAGNLGRNALGQTVYGSVTSPGNAQGAITVGAANNNLTNGRGDDTVAPFSSRGPTRFDYFVKPDVLATGYQVGSLLAPGSTLESRYPTLKIGSSYFRLNGTSQAAPVIAGAAALLLQANPRLTAHTVKGIIQFTAQRLPQLDVMTQGAGEVNIAGAVRFAKLIYADARYGRRWTMGSRQIVRTDLLFNETVYWSRAVLWGTQVKANTTAVYMRLAQWDDNIVWGYLADNIVWSMDENIVWSLLDENIVWGQDEENIVWGLTDDNIVWGFDDNIVWGADNIVWGADNITWSLSMDAVLAFSEAIDQLEGQSILAESILEEGVR